MKGNKNMILEFATKRNQNGNRYYLGIDTDKKVFSRERGHWYTKDDVIEITKHDRNNLIEQLESENYKEIEHIL